MLIIIWTSFREVFVLFLYDSLQSFVKPYGVFLPNDTHDTSRCSGSDKLPFNNVNASVKRLQEKHVITIWFNIL